MDYFSDIKTREDFFNILNIPLKNMTYLLYNKEKKGTENSYHSFEIKKRNGGVRVIHAPNKELKFVQQRLLKALWRNQTKVWHDKKINPSISHGFQKGRSIMTNAEIHRNKKFVLNVDLEDFFNSFHFGRVKGFFEKDRDFKVPQAVALIIAQLVCYKGSLPQGAPTSPLITNLICRIMDLRLLKLAKRYKLDYTRYADDLTFSTNDSSFSRLSQEFLLKLESEIKRAGFNLNPEKTRLQYKNSRQSVTGLVVNKKLNVPNEYYKKTRAMAHTLYTNGSFLIDGVEGTLAQLEGRLSFINQLEKRNNLSINSGSKDYKNLGRREKEYQKFIYFKYFYANTRPTILTEGKTDSRYLKAALKKLYKNYPNLIEYKNGEFVFKILFLHRADKEKPNKTTRLKFFFNIGPHGADSLAELYYFSSNKKSKVPGYINYLEYFKKLNQNMLTKPTIIVFDNELSSNGKPLRTFINSLKDEQEMHISNIRRDLSTQVTDNLYILTNKLVGTRTEAEIEDLFDDKTRNKEIDGRTFSATDIGEQYYGKNIFSLYILKNYKEVDFSNFKPMLDKLNEIIINFK
ncbi:RNA-directed DNA polymerase [Listeria booriae]|uniref:retron Ec67 family RNA-directed DNA polymerase/endonuclease n=1 Tax=Listeria booriae TaxID=1552123 RepID=UPI0016244871|nr:retron Ec67 family RNA-directed DNA polymerase/endonuclease [Listeria booriae]MBC2080806.1 RNA-directed DNA polymerase [Listeria booriae]